MASTYMIYNNPTLKLALSEVGLATGTAYECQVNEARVTYSSVIKTTPANGCNGETDAAGKGKYSLHIVWQQDWANSATTSLSRFAFDNAEAEAWFELVPDKTDTATKLTGHILAVFPGDMGGTFGDGAVGQATSDWPLAEKPELTAPAAV